jgi:WD40 repeat protein
LLATLEQHSADVRDLSFTDAGTYLLSGSDDGTIRYWPLQALHTRGISWLEKLEAEHGLALDGSLVSRDVPRPAAQATP